MLEARAVSYGYRGVASEEDRVVVRGASVVVEPGRVLALVGPNGAGKSTLARILCGSLAASSGCVRLDGHDVLPDELCGAVGFVRQDPESQIVAPDVFDEVAFGPCNLGLPVSDIRARVSEALHVVGLDGFGDRAVSTLSGGELQRVALAGVLAMRPRYLVLDEATSQLDPTSRQQVRGIVRSLAGRGVGVLFVTHDLEDLCAADKVAVMAGGSVEWTGDLWALLALGEADAVSCAVGEETTGEVASGEGAHGASSLSGERAVAAHVTSTSDEGSAGTRVSSSAAAVVASSLVSGSSLGRMLGALARVGFTARPGAEPDVADMARTLRTRGGVEASQTFAHAAAASDSEGARTLRTRGGVEASQTFACGVTGVHDPGKPRTHQTCDEAESAHAHDAAGVSRNGSPHASAGALELRDVVVRYGERPALDGLSLACAPGRITLVAGRSGAGKSTAARVAAGLVPPDAGVAMIGGEPPHPGSVGLCLQRPENQLFCDTVLEDVAFGPRNLGANDETARRRAIEALGSLGVDEALWGRSPFALSGGQRRRVALAGVVALDPAAFVLDEPTAGLDAEGRAFLHRVVCELASLGKPVAVVSHDVGEWLEVADDVALVSAGRLVWQGAAVRLVEDPAPLGRAGLDVPLWVRLRARLVERATTHPAAHPAASTPADPPVHSTARLASSAGSPADSVALPTAPSSAGSATYPDANPTAQTATDSDEDPVARPNTGEVSS